jgi:hypothetical protein
MVVVVFAASGIGTYPLAAPFVPEVESEMLMPVTVVQVLSFRENRG